MELLLSVVAFALVGYLAYLYGLDRGMSGRGRGPDKFTDRF